jgi:hypothetical protein
MGIFSLITGFMEVFRQQDIWGGLTRKSAFVLADTPYDRSFWKNRQQALDYLRVAVLRRYD